MSSILNLLQSCELRRFEAGEIVLKQGERTGLLFVLVEGAVEVIKDDVQVATASEPAAVFGELSTFLGGPHKATVRALQPCAFYIVENPRATLESTPQLCIHVCELLARRLDALTKYLVDVKHQFEGHDHIGMVDSVLETLLHRQPRQHVRPGESTIRQGELSD